MNIAYFNGNFLPKDQIHISPDDRGFLFADGVYEVIKWYQWAFFDMDGHMVRLKRGLSEISVDWPGIDSFPSIALRLIKDNNLSGRQALIYLQVTRGAATRTHSFPPRAVEPTVYALATPFVPENPDRVQGVGVMPGNDIRWKRCDIKSVALLPNVLSYQKALDNGFSEFAFVRDGFITECTHSNIFFVLNSTLYTHPESEHILSGVTRKNIIRIAAEAGIPVKEEPLHQNRAGDFSEVFLTSTSLEIAPVIRFGKNVIGDGIPGPLTRIIMGKFSDEVCSGKGRSARTF